MTDLHFYELHFAFLSPEKKEEKKNIASEEPANITIYSDSSRFSVSLPHANCGASEHRHGRKFVITQTRFVL